MDRCRSQMYNIMKNTMSRKEDSNSRRHSSSTRKLANIIADFNQQVKAAEPDSISSKDLRHILCHQSRSEHEHVILLDCRYPFEFKSGRIVGSFNVRTQEQLLRLSGRFNSSKSLFVFYSEFSTKRASAVYSVFQKKIMHSRTKNGTECKCVILEKGFKKFHDENPDLCIGEYRSCASGAPSQTLRYKKEFRTSILKEFIPDKRDKTVRFAGLNH